MLIVLYTSKFNLTSLKFGDSHFHDFDETSLTKCSKGTYYRDLLLTHCSAYVETVILNGFSMTIWRFVKFIKLSLCQDIQ